MWTIIKLTIQFFIVIASKSCAMPCGSWGPAPSSPISLPALGSMLGPVAGTPLESP